MKRGRPGTTRVERAARARRRRALAHLEQARNRRNAAPRRAFPRLGAGAAVLGLSLALGVLSAERWTGAGVLEKVSVRGARHLEPASIARASGVAPGARLAGLDPEAVARTLAAHAWIREARVLRLPGGRLLIEVEERRPRAVLDADEAWAVDASGRPFAPAQEAEGLEALPRIEAAEAYEPGSSHPALAEAVSLARRLPHHGLPAPLRVGIAAGGDPEGFSLELPQLRARVVLGWEDLDARLAELARLLEAELPELELATRVDLRFRGQAVLDDSPPRVGAAQAAARTGGEAPSIKRPAG